jgi:hypothetical protein
MPWRQLCDGNDTVGNECSSGREATAGAVGFVGKGEI